MNNISLKNSLPHTAFKFYCQNCGSDKLVITPLDILYYKSSENFNPFFDGYIKPKPLLNAIKSCSELLYVCKKCEQYSVVRFDSAMVSYLHVWAKSNKIKAWHSIDKRETV